jgi:ribonuclease R
MSYNDVYKIITNSDEAVVKRYEKYVSCFKDMEELAHILKDKRQNQGYLNLEIPESKIILDKNGKAIDVKKYEINFANEIIEQFMLTANETIAEKFFWLEAPFIYRVHEAPDLDKIEETNQVLFFGGYRIKASKDNINPKAFADVLNQTNGTSEEKIMSTLILRTLKLARYEAENKGHFGIASKYYCHFTSPIRRYPDLFIHRVISEYLENDYLLSEERIQELNEKAVKYAKISSDAEMLATKVEREAESIKKAEFMADKIGQEFDGIISSLTNFGMFVQLENTVEGLVRFEDMGFDDYFTLDDKRKILVGEQSGKVFKIGKKTRVRVIEANKILRKVSFELVNGKAQPQEL